MILKSRPKPEDLRYCYAIRYLNPQDGMGGWAFQIELSMRMARWLWGMAKPDNEEHFRQRMHEILANVRRHSGLEHLVDEERVPLQMPRFNFWEDRALLTNISVPGNACGLDMDERDYDLVKQLSPPHQVARVRYLSHNVDSMLQAMSLIALFAGWAELIPYLDATAEVS